MGSAARPGAPITLILAFVFPAIISAAVALAYFGYRYAADEARRMESFLSEDAREQAGRLFRAVEDRIDEGAASFFREVRAGLEDSTIASACEVPGDPLVTSYVVLREDEKVDCQRPPPRQGAKSEWEILKGNIQWQTLNKQVPSRYLHLASGQGSELVAYTTGESDLRGRTYVAARINLKLVKEWIDAELRQPGRRRFEVRDERWHPVFSNISPGGDERLLYEGPFGKALYLWRVRIAPGPQDVERLEADAARRRVLGPLLVILSTVIITVGLAIVWLAVLAERRASRLKSDFIANVSHELKTPLSLIRMFGELVATGKHKGEATAREYGGIITRESERLSHLIDNVLDFARLERGKASYDFSEGQLGDLVERALDICRYRLDKEKVRLHTEIELDLPSVRMDDNAMTLVVLNLVDNAIKYAADGGEVTVGLARTPGGMVLSVRDFGPGIEPEEQRRIFDRFYRARAARDRNVRGSGIGLALVQHIAQAHGGRVTVESPVADNGASTPGAIFRVFLPAPVLEVHDLGGAGLAGDLAVEATSTPVPVPASPPLTAKPSSTAKPS